jgi:hypothetical protein
MKIYEENPFETIRWEEDREHLFWLPPFFEKLERNRCAYLIGTRGAGKTTILKALDWKQRLTNKSLQMQVKDVQKEELFSKRYIGIYLDVGKKYILDDFYEWLFKGDYSNESIWQEIGQLFSFYIEYLSIFHLIEAIEGLKYHRIVNYSPEDELTAVEEILKLRPEIKERLSVKNGIYNLEDIKYSIKQIYENIWNNSRKFESQTKSEVTSAFQIGTILEELSKPLLNLCKSDSKEFFLKICIDSVDNLRSEFIHALNTLIASQEEHTSFIFASTHQFIDTETTFIHNHPLSTDDREIINIDEFYQKIPNFDLFIHEVTRLRFEKILGHSNFQVDLKNILGVYSINELLDFEFKKTISPEGKKFADYVRNEFSVQWNILMKSIKREPLNENSNKKTSKSEKAKNIVKPKNNRAPPYIQAYLTDKLKINLEDYVGNVEKFRILTQTEYSKKTPSAMLAICYDDRFPSRLSVPYAGYKIVRSLSDSNIRDFIRQMRCIYKNSSHKNEKFLRSKISYYVQKKSILEASLEKFAEINQGPSYAVEIKNMVQILGQITHILQTRASDALKITERGIFIIDYSSIRTKDERQLLQKIIFKASVNKYYIKVFDPVQNPINKEIVLQKIRLHCLFAPYFNFSYRPPTKGWAYELEIDPSELLNICNSPLRDDDKKQAQRLLTKIPQRSLTGKQLTLLNWEKYDRIF